MKKIIIIIALFVSTLCKAQTPYYDTVHVKCINMKMVGTYLQMTAYWGVVDTFSNFLLREHPPVAQPINYVTHVFKISFYNVYGQNILTNFHDSVFNYTRRVY